MQSTSKHVVAYQHHVWYLLPKMMRSASGAFSSMGLSKRCKFTMSPCPQSMGDLLVKVVWETTMIVQVCKHCKVRSVLGFLASDLVNNLHWSTRQQGSSNRWLQFENSCLGLPSCSASRFAWRPVYRSSKNPSYASFISHLFSSCLLSILLMRINCQGGSPAVRIPSVLFAICPYLAEPTSSCAFGCQFCNGFRSTGWSSKFDNSAQKTACMGIYHDFPLGGVMPPKMGCRL